MKIEKLTKSQEKELINFRNEMLAFGRSTEPSDRKITESIITDFYFKIEKKRPMFFWFDGPFTGYIAIEIIRKNLQEILGDVANLRSNLWSNLRSNLGSNLESNLVSNLGSNLRSNLRSNLVSNLWSNLESNLESNLWSNLESNLWSNLESNLESNLWSNLGSNLWSNLESNLRSNLRSNLWSNLRSNLYNTFWGQHNLSWIAFYKFCNDIGVQYDKSDIELLSQWLKLSCNTGWWVPFENICFCFERHSILQLNKDGRLHCENGPAMAFRDGYELYYLNGVAMSKEYVCTSAEQLSPSVILKQENVEVRRELLRKIGIERFIQEVGAKELHSLKINELNTEYTLLELDLSVELKSQKYLKMLNPSIGIWHVEGVDNSCKTVMEALHSRKPKKLRDLPIDDINGKEWYQQGDVAVWPKKAKSVKSLPSVLT